MRHRVTLVLACITLALGSACLAEKIPLESHTSLAGVRSEYEIERSRLAKLPTWTPEAGEPPLGVVAAIASARQWLQGKTKLAAKDFTVSFVRLSRTPTDARHWFYVVELVEGWGDINRHIGHIAVVLLDGSIVEPTTSNR